LSIAQNFTLIWIKPAFRNVRRVGLGRTAMQSATAVGHVLFRKLLPLPKLIRLADSRN